MAYNGTDLAKHIVRLCIDENSPISNLQLQKILYYLQFGYYKNKCDILIKDDFEAWQFGPVISDVYDMFCTNGGEPISFMLPEANSEKIEYNDEKYIDKRVRKLRNMNPWDMVEETHKEGTAWYITYDNGRGYKRIIEKSLIFEKGLL